MSLVLRDWPELLPLAAAVAVAETAGDEARIKWPNDILVAAARSPGSSIEGRPQEGWAVLGIGVNVAVREFPAELRDIAGSLGRRPPTSSRSSPRLLARLERRLAGRRRRR